MWFVLNSQFKIAVAQTQRFQQNHNNSKLPFSFSLSLVLQLMAASSSTTFGTIPDLPIVDDSTLADQLTIIDTAFDQFSDFLLSENASFVSSCTYLQTCKNGEDPVAVDISSVPWPVFSKCLSLHSGVPHESLKPLLDVTGGDS